MSKILVMGTLKGGAGKTMNGFNIGGILAEKAKVLFIDADPQCNLTANCGIDIRDRNAASIRDIFENRPSAQPTPDLITVESPIPELKNIDVIPSSIFLFATERLLYQKSDRERILQKYIEKNKDFFNRYDYIIIDTNPSMSFTNINAFLVADEILLSCDVSENSLAGAELFCELWDETREELGVEDNIAAMIISNFDGRSNLAKDLSDYTQETPFSKDIVLKTYVTTTVRLKEAEVKHKPINVLYPKSKSCEQYREIVAEMKERSIV